MFGVDELFLKSLDCGAKGWVGSTYNHIAPLYFEIKRLYEKGEVDLAEDLTKKKQYFLLKRLILLVDTMVLQKGLWVFWGLIVVQVDFHTILQTKKHMM